MAQAGTPVKYDASGIDKMIAKLNIDMKMQTDPNLLNDILKNDMYLADMKSFTDQLGEKLTKPQDLNPLFEEMRNGILTLHPAICEFASAAVKGNLLPEIGKADPWITRSIHHTYLLEYLLQGMVKDWKFMIEVYEHVIKKRTEFGIRESFFASAWDVFRLTGGLFEVAKTKTKDADFLKYNSMRSKGSVDKKDADSRRKALPLNISEAVTADYVRGFKDNALSGAVLAAIQIKSVSISDGERRLKLELSQGWCSLYQTWNLAFITAKLDFLHILYPKLLAPAVMNAAPHDYIFIRGMGLWLSINFGLFKKVTKASSPKLPGKDALSKVWGEINLKHAKVLFKEEKGMELVSFFSIFKLKIREFCDRFRSKKN